MNLYPFESNLIIDINVIDAIKNNKKIMELIIILKISLFIIKYLHSIF